MASENSAENEKRRSPSDARILDTALTSVEHTADPQTDAAIKLVAWVTHGMLQPSRDDFAMLRLILLALLPQIGGILLMVSRSALRGGGS